MTRGIIAIAAAAAIGALVASVFLPGGARSLRRGSWLLHSDDDAAGLPTISMSLIGTGWTIPDDLILPDPENASTLADLCSWASMQPLLAGRPGDVRRLWVTVLYDKEADHLLTYLAELGDLVAAVVVVEAPVTFSGRPKPLGFKQASRQFARWGDKLVHVVVEDLGDVEDAWDKEARSRAAGLMAVRRLSPSAQDWVMALDVDELVSHRAASALTKCFLPHAGARLLRLGLRTSAFAVSCRFDPAQLAGEDKVFAMPWEMVERIGISRAARVRQWGMGHLGTVVVPDAGWQLKWMLSLRETVLKVEAFSHQELNTAHVKDPDSIRRAYREGTDLYSRQGQPACSYTPLLLLQPPAPRLVLANVPYFCSRGWVRGDDCPEGALRGGVGDRNERGA